MKFTSQLTATLVQFMGDDLMVVNAARVSVGGHSDVLDAKDIGLINYLAKSGHTSPFEHNSITFLIDAPIFVAREWMRHRTQSYNETSGRYHKLEPRFYVPGEDRPLVQQGKPGEYTFIKGNSTDYAVAISAQLPVYRMAYQAYDTQLSMGVAKEVARMCLPVSTYTQWYATANLLNWLRFLKLRTADNAMWEIRQLALQVEDALRKLFPHSMNVWADKL